MPGSDEDKSFQSSFQYFEEAMTRIKAKPDMGDRLSSSAPPTPANKSARALLKSQDASPPPPVSEIDVERFGHRGSFARGASVSVLSDVHSRDTGLGMGLRPDPVQQTYREFQNNMLDSSASETNEFGNDSDFAPLDDEMPTLFRASQIMKKSDFNLIPSPGHSSEEEPNLFVERSPASTEKLITATPNEIDIDVDLERKKESYLTAEKPAVASDSIPEDIINRPQQITDTTPFQYPPTTTTTKTTTPNEKEELITPPTAICVAGISDDSSIPIVIQHRKLSDDLNSYDGDDEQEFSALSYRGLNDFGNTRHDCGWAILICSLFAVIAVTITDRVAKNYTIPDTPTDGTAPSCAPSSSATNVSQFPTVSPSIVGTGRFPSIRPSVVDASQFPTVSPSDVDTSQFSQFPTTTPTSALDPSLESWCGSSFTNAAEKCSQPCKRNRNCPSNEMCFANVISCSSDKHWCNGECGNLPCPSGEDWECPKDQTCVPVEDCYLNHRADAFAEER